MRMQWKPFVVVVGLLLLLTWLLIQSRSADPTLRSRIHDALARVQLHDTELTRDVLLARAGLLPNYDPLAETNRRLTRAVEELQANSATIAGEPGKQITVDTQTLAGALQEKVRLVEYFKADNALLRNSLAYFIHTGQALSGQPGIDPALATEMAALSQALLRLLHTPDLTGGREIEKAVSRLESAAPSQQSLQDLAKHGRLIVRLLPQVDQAARQILATPTIADADRLQDAALRYSDRIEAHAQVFRVSLYLVAVCLLAYLLYQFERLRANALRLRHSNIQLQQEMEQRRGALDALRGSEERFRAIAESANDAIVSADRSGNIVSWNPKARSIFGYSANEILGSNLTRLMPARYREAHTHGFERWATEGCSRMLGATIELTGARKDGSEFPIEVSLSSWSTSHGSYITGTIRDLTERKRLQETTRRQELQLIQANKMTALGTLVSGVAHEINNPNQLVMTNCAIVAQAWEDAVEFLDAYQHNRGEFSLAGLPYSEMRSTLPLLIRDAQDGALRIMQIIADLKGFARPAQVAAQPFQLNEAVQRALRLLAHLIQKNTDRFGVELSEGLPLLHGDAQHAEQIIVNLVVNALEALPTRTSAVTVRTSWSRTERRVLLEVADEGIGIPYEHRPRLCDPFFTTKQASGGTGLGLAITSSLIQSHAGKLTFGSEPGKGTRVVVSFPIVPAELPATLDPKCNPERMPQT
jgi:PAS domain S-box-containing protein